ncbi:hypothetical protein CR513_12140, partial [Mucuna pruriens]
MSITRQQESSSNGDDEDTCNACSVRGGDEAISYRFFLRTLRGVVIQWFSGLPPRTIHTFNDLAMTFMSQFVANQPKKLEVVDLFDIKQARREPKKVPCMLQQCNGPSQLPSSSNKDLIEAVNQ